MTPRSGTHARFGLLVGLGLLGSIPAYGKAGSDDATAWTADGTETIELRAVDHVHLQFPGPFADNGREAQIPIDFPKGNWVNIQMRLTVESMATAGRCTYPNPTGDIFDRSASVFLILDESCLAGFRCMGSDNQIELMKAITPFGTDDRTGPRVLTMDVTPFAPLLSGTKYIGVWVDTFDPNGWYATVDFTLTADPLQASVKPPAAGIIPLFFKQGVSRASQPTIDPITVTIPATANQVLMRLYATGHGSVVQPPCNQPADEFCRRNNRILVDGNSIWEHIVWRTDCNPQPETCRAWNACGYPSCTFPRAGWCPGYIACHDNADQCDQDIDVTDFFPAGETHDVLYEIQEIGMPGSGNLPNWNYSLVLYWYE